LVFFSLEFHVLGLQNFSSWFKGKDLLLVIA